MITKIISGGQTGVDRAGLDTALELGIPSGGWCPKGRLAENGRIPSSYSLCETPSRHYAQRTEWNVRDSDGTLLLTQGDLSGGSLLTVEIAKRLNKPYLVVQLEQLKKSAVIWQWINLEVIHTLNIAGPRESGCPGIYQDAKMFLLQVFK